MQLYTVDKWRGARHEVNPERSLCAFRVVYTVQDCVSWGDGERKCSKKQHIERLAVRERTFQLS